MTMGKRSVISAVGVLLTLFAAASPATEASDTHCPSSVLQRPELAAARTALEAAPQLPARRISLSDLLVQAKCYDEAIHILEDGEALNPRNVLLQSRLSQARSMVREEQYFAGLDDAEATARLARGKLRCTRLSDVAACDEVLNLQPRNVEILIAKGDALVKANRSQEAAGIYARASQSAPDNALVTAKLQALTALHQEQQKRCADGQGDTALEACIAIVVKGAANEFELTKRIAILQQSTNQQGHALDSYIAANALRPGDRSVALAILALLNSTKRDDAIALAAKGSSLLTLGRPGEAIAPLRQANALAPGLPEVAKQLARAEALARYEPVNHKDAKPQIAGNVATDTPAAARTYSNAAVATRSN
jgi:tetratricopeptide (TPR) repeat protein